MTSSYDYATANKIYFNDLTYDDPRIIKLAKRSAQVIRKHYPFDEHSTLVMDFACGTGLISKELAPYAKSIVGVDISQGVVDRYNLSVSNQGIPPEEMRAVCAELRGRDEELDGLKFDVITCNLAYHHFESIGDVTRILAFFLKPGGVLLVVDILNLNPTEGCADADASLSAESIFPDHVHHIVAHKAGFREDDIRDTFTSAGLVSFHMEAAIPVKKYDKDLQLFLAKGTKPVEPEYTASGHHVD